MINIIYRTLKDRFNLIAAYSSGVIAFMWMYIALFPYIRDQASMFSNMFDAYPKSFMEAFGISDIAAQFSQVQSYLSTEMFTFIFPIIVVAIAVGFAASGIAGEIEKGTIEFLLSQPISRFKLFFAKYISAFIALVIFTSVSILSAIPMCEIYKIDYSISPFLKFVLIAFLFGWSIMSLGFLMSSIFSDKGKPIFVVTGIVVLTYVFNILATLKPSLDKFRYASFFHYFDPSKVLGRGELDVQSIWVLLGVSVVCTIAAAFWFNRRNITTA